MCLGFGLITGCWLVGRSLGGMETKSKSENGHRVTVWYDGGCPLCVREIGLMDRLDRRDRIEFVDVDREDAVCPIDRDLLLARLHAREDGEMVDGAAAFAAMWRAIPVMRPLGLVARNRVVLWLLERAYRGFLVVRPAVQRVFVRIFGDGEDGPAAGRV